MAGGAAQPKKKFNNASGSFVGKDDNLNDMGVKLNFREGVQGENFDDSFRKLGVTLALNLTIERTSSK